MEREWMLGMTDFSRMIPYGLCSMVTHSHLIHIALHLLHSNTSEPFPPNWLFL